MTIPTRFLYLVVACLLGFSSSTVQALEFRINAGGPDYTDVSGDLFVADKAFVAGDFGFLSGAPRTFGNPIAGTTDDPLYQGLRYASLSSDSGTLSYAFDGLPAADYDVTLYFMEPYQTTGGRLQDVFLEGVLELDDFDIFAATGGLNTAHTEQLTTTVSDGRLDIDFVVTSKQALVSAISVVQVTAPTVQDISIAPTSLDYGNVTIASTSDLVVTVSNVGGAALTVSGLTTATAEFTVVSPLTPFTIPAGGAAVDVTVRFAPAAASTFNDSLTITSDDPDEGTVNVPLQGNGSAPGAGLEFRINAGGPDYTDVSGDLFVADKAFVAGDFGFLSGAPRTFGNPIAGTTDDPLYQGSRYASLSSDSGTLSYAFDGLPAADYDVTLYFMEPYQTTGGRLQDVFLEGVLELDDFDIFAATGGLNTAHTEQLTTTVSDGRLDIDFVVTSKQALVSAISVVQVTAPTVQDISIAPTSLDYGNVTIASTSDLVVTVSNVGGAALTVSGLTTATAEFTVVSPLTPFTIPAGGAAVDVTVRFAPAAASTFNDSLTITSDDPDEGTVNVPLQGNGSAPGAGLEFRINAGGPDYTDVSGDLFVADKAFVAGDFGFLSGAPRTFGNPIAGTTDDPLYQGLRYASLSSDSGTLSYAFDGLPAADYDVTLYFMEPYQTTGGRLQDVFLEGVLELDDFDIFAATGGLNTAHTEQLTTTVSDGRLDIDFVVTSKQALVSAISVVQVTAPTVQDISIAPTSLDYGNVTIASTSDLVVTVSNVGGAALTVSGLTTATAEFTVVSPLTPFTIPAGGAAVDVTVRFAPAAASTFNDSLTITSDDPDEGTVNVPLQGNGVVETIFADAAAETGLTLGHSLAAICAPPLGSGSAWADFDNDNDIDLFVTDHGGANHLYRNDGDTDVPADGLPNFTDVALSLGLDDPAEVSHSVVFIDYDNDGDQDIYVTHWGGNTLYQNRLVETGSVSFLDATAIAGIGDGGRATTTAWGDFNEDGYLDVYIAKHAYCIKSPVDLRNQDHLFLSNGPDMSGNITFTDATDRLCAGSPSCPQVFGLGFAPGWVDYDNDGDLDLYLVNDFITTAPIQYHNVLWRNDGAVSGWTFTDVSTQTGTDIALNGMGLGIGDYDNNGWFDFAFSNVGSNYLLNNSSGNFTDVALAAGVQRPLTPLGDTAITWGTVFFDYDNDGWEDLYIVGGEIGTTAVPQPGAFYRSNADAPFVTFSDLSVASGLDHPERGRNASIVDFDGDGFVDLFLGSYGVPPVLFHNTRALQGSTNHWLTVTVEGTVSNRDAIGARLWLTTPDGVTQMREISTGSTHGGGDYRAAYFGLGGNTTYTLTIRWPSGVVQILGMPVPVDQSLHLVE